MRPSTPNPSFSSRRARRPLALATPVLAALLVQSCLLPEVELSDEPAQEQGNLIGQAGSSGAPGGAPGTAGAAGSSTGAGGAPAAGAGGIGGASDAPPPTDLSPGGTGGSSSVPPVAPQAPCSNGDLDEGESDVDCGGACAACVDGAACTSNLDCASARCEDELCASPASCNDGAQNQDETAADCGGSTCSARCAANQSCRADADCQSGLFCGAAGVCSTPSCGDQRRNGDETAIDCGGSCPACATGATCTRPADCSSQICSGGVCAAPSCSDRLQNQGETAVDCGGPCGLCAPGQACTSAAQCSTNICAAAACPAGVARCCQPDPCPGPVACQPGQRRCSNDGDSLEECNDCQNGFAVIEECTLACLAIAGTFVCDLPSLPSLPL